jgi:sulfatase maturation enzyme AslB (radical SAM superfamily)
MPPVPAIETLAIVFSADCNLRCRYCYQDRKRPVQISWQAVSAALDLLERSPRRCEKLSFFGGEPLLAFPLIARAVRRVGRRLPRRRRPSFFLTTNGLLLTDRRVAFLERHRFKDQLSFDGVAPAQDLRLPGSFTVLDRLLDRLRLRHRAYFRKYVAVAVTLTATTIPHLADSFDYLLGKGVQDIAIGPAMGHPRLSKAQAGELERQFGRIFRQSRRHYRATGEVPLALFRKPAPDARAPDAAEWACTAPAGRDLTVDVDGEVYPCALLIRSCQRVARPALARRLAAMSLGSVADAQTIAAKQEAAQVVAARAGIFGPQRLKRSSLARCATCPHAGVCLVCPMACAKNPDSADATRIPHFQCAFNRTVFDYRRRFPVQH